MSFLPSKTKSRPPPKSTFTLMVLFMTNNYEKEFK